MRETMGWFPEASEENSQNPEQKYFSEEDKKFSEAEKGGYPKPDEIMGENENVDRPECASADLVKRDIKNEPGQGEFVSRKPEERGRSESSAELPAEKEEKILDKESLSDNQPDETVSGGQTEAVAGEEPAASVNYEKIPALLEQLLADFKPAPERLNIKVDVKKIGKEGVEQFCRENGDTNAYDKMHIHELVEEPVVNILALCQEGGKKIEKKDFEKLLVDLGYNVNVLLSKRHGCDYDAAMNVNGYSVPGWDSVVGTLRKFDNNLAVFFGKRFAPGISRLHVRMFEGNNHTYVIPHIDEFNWINSNIRGVEKSHKGSGQAEFVNAGKYFLESLERYFKDKS